MNKLPVELWHYIFELNGENPRVEAYYTDLHMICGRFIKGPGFLQMRACGRPKEEYEALIRMLSKIKKIMALQIRMFGPISKEMRDLHNIFTDLGYPVYMDFINRGNKQWRHINKETSFFYYFDGNPAMLWSCGNDDEADLQLTPCDPSDGGDGLLYWMEELIDGNVKVYPYCDPPKAQIVELPVFENVEGSKEYTLETKLVNDCMFYQVVKPFVDRPYVTVVRDFEKNGHKRFFTNLFVCNSWGIASKDIQFLHKAWEWFNMEGVMDLDVLMKEATEACNGLETEPEVWRSDMKSVLKIFNKRAGFYFEQFIYFFFFAGSSCSNSTLVTLMMIPALTSFSSFLLYQAPISA